MFILALGKGFVVWKKRNVFFLGIAFLEIVAYTYIL